VDIPRQGVWVDGDTARLTQVITNLLNNAAKYTPEGGRITLRVAVDGPNAVVRVTDTGMGIPPEMLSAIFDLFTQANRSIDRAQGGLGVGLTLVRRLVELQGGSVRAYSEGLDRGSEFEVRLPLSQRVPPSAVDAVGEPGPRPTRRVVLVDDNVDCTVTLAELLRLVGHEVVTADNGVTGVELVRHHRPDLAVFDIGLPGIDGFEAAKQVRADPELTGVRLVAMSGYGREEDRQSALDAGFERLLVKPVEFAEIRALLDEVQVAREVEDIGPPKLPVVVA
jgi:CheY-like chemotaxis protein